jgi:Zn-dependent M32 family carboxypeptidase
MDNFNYRDYSNEKGYDLLKALYEKPIKAIKIEDLINELRHHAATIKAAIEEAEAVKSALSPGDVSVLDNAKRQLFRIETHINRFEKFKRWGI